MNFPDSFNHTQNVYGFCYKFNLREDGNKIDLVKSLSSHRLLLITLWQELLRTV